MKSGTYGVCVLALATFASVTRASQPFNLTWFYSVHAGTALVEIKGTTAETPYTPLQWNGQPNARSSKDTLSLGVGRISFALSQLPPLAIGFQHVLRANVGLGAGKSARLEIERTGKSGRVLFSGTVGRQVIPITIVLGEIEPEARLQWTVTSEDASARVVFDYPTIEAMWAIPLQAMPEGPRHWTLPLGGLLGEFDYRLVTPLETDCAEVGLNGFLEHREPITQMLTQGPSSRTRLERGETRPLDLPLGFFHRTEKLAWNLKSEGKCRFAPGTSYLLEGGPAKKLGVHLERADAEKIANFFSPLNQSGIPWARGGLVRIELSDPSAAAAKIHLLKGMGFQVAVRVSGDGAEARMRTLAEALHAKGRKIEFLEAEGKALASLHRLRESGSFSAITSAQLVLSVVGETPDAEALRFADAVSVSARPIHLEERLTRVLATAGRRTPIWIVESEGDFLSFDRRPLPLLEAIQAAAQNPLAQVPVVILFENEPGPETVSQIPESRMLGAYGP